MKLKNDAQHQALADRVLVLRQKSGMSLRELGRRGGTNAATVSDVELGVYDPKMSTMRAIAKGLGMSLSELFEGL